LCIHGSLSKGRLGGVWISALILIEIETKSNELVYTW
jgi:hypothetical protein